METRKGEGRPRADLSRSGPTFRIHRDLAEEIGFAESVVFLQLEFSVSTSAESVECDGHLWIRWSLRQLRRDLFRWWSIAKLSKLLNRLEDLGLICSAAFDESRADTTRSYAIRWEGVRALRSLGVVIYQEQGNCKAGNDFPVETAANSADRNDFPSRTGGVQDVNAPRSERKTLHREIKKSKKKESSSTSSAPAKTLADAADDDFQKTVFDLFTELTGRKPNAADRASAEQLRGVHPEIIRQEMIEVRRRAGNKRIHSLEYFVAAILKKAAELSHDADAMAALESPLEQREAPEPSSSPSDAVVVPFRASVAPSEPTIRGTSALQPLTSVVRELAPLVEAQPRDVELSASITPGEDASSDPQHDPDEERRRITLEGIASARARLRGGVQRDASS